MAKFELTDYRLLYEAEKERADNLHTACEALRKTRMDEFAVAFIPHFLPAYDDPSEAVRTAYRLADTTLKVREGI